MSLLTSCQQSSSSQKYNKIDYLLGLINKQYVDTVDIHDIIERAMPEILSELDPHSSYIPAEDLQQNNDELEGSFSGIGVQFTINHDTLHINDVITGGPSEKVGIMPGDRIIKVDDSLFIGKICTNREAMKRLKGPQGSKVKLEISRRNVKKLIPFEITRDRIPQHSIETMYMITPQIGYIQIDRFARTTPIEMLTAIARLNHQGAKSLIIDLRGNTGGYMESAVQMANEFLPENAMIVFSQGRSYPKSEEYANGRGSSLEVPLAVLIDEGSASASEIFSGAIQDNDRGLIIGRRSFGKGLVQQPIAFSDGSAIRLTVARYYTPSGRCIQRPYKDGQDMDYQLDLLHRYQNGEFFHEDSIKLNRDSIYYTVKGRKVYGGGGIMPDIFVPRDTTGVSSYLAETINNGTIRQWAFGYTDNNRKTLVKYDNLVKMVQYLNTQSIVPTFVNYASKHDIKRRTILINKSYKLLRMNLYGAIIYNILGRQSYMAFINKTDDTVNRAITELKNKTTLEALASTSKEEQ
ncbi:MAG: S41 family peptidase [Bacteroidaceae bacterium]